MRAKRLIAMIVIAAIGFFLGWACKRATVQDAGLTLSGESADSELVPLLDGRKLVFLTNANVPLKIEWGGEGYDLLELAGIPKHLRPFSYNVGRRPIRDEWNIAVMNFSDNSIGEVSYLTENCGSYMHPRLNCDGNYVVATLTEGEDQEIIFLQGADSIPMFVSPSPSIDRWPSITCDGNAILFHSFIDGNPGGDFYLAERQPDSNSWITDRLTYEHDTEYLWPMIDATGQYCVFVERLINSESGMIRMVSVRNNRRSDWASPYQDPHQVKFPSISSGGKIVCWNELIDDTWSVMVWYREFGMRLVGPLSSPKHPGYGWVQPSISSDGKIVAFIDDQIGLGLDRIGICNLETGDVIYLDGCGGNIMFPSLN